MQYLKRNTKFGILSFLTIILTLTNYIQFLTKTDAYFSFIKIPNKNIFKNINEHFMNRLYSLNYFVSFNGTLK